MSRPGKLCIFSATALLAAAPSIGQDVKLRVVDVGAGLCVVATTADGHAMVYDTGAGSTICGNAVAELVPSKKIDLLALSHSDIDHPDSDRARPDLPQCTVGRSTPSWRRRRA